MKCKLRYIGLTSLGGQQELAFSLATHGGVARRSYRCKHVCRQEESGSIMQVKLATESCPEKSSTSKQQQRINKQCDLKTKN